MALAPLDSRLLDKQLLASNTTSSPAMPPRLPHPGEYELVERTSSDSNEPFILDDTDFESQRLTSTSYGHRQQINLSQILLQFVPSRLRAALYKHRLQRRRTKKPHSHRFGLVGASQRRCCLILGAILGIIGALLLFAALFTPSYLSPPAHYQVLRSRILLSSNSGRGNPDKHKVFIAASLYDKGGRLVNGAWGKAVLELINILGSENVYLSIYENDGGPDAHDALDVFKQKVQCPHTLVFDEQISLNDIDYVTFPDGSRRVKRIAYLAEVRNRALRPLDEPSAIKFDRLLYLNDIIFDPIDATQLLFSTHANSQGKANYLAACAVDFINPLKFYDTFATRDFEGYSLGVPFFPWFTSSGKGLSRRDVLEGTDAVRVKSCWGGMVAFDAQYFQATDKAASNYERDGSIESISRSNSLIRFRAEPDLYWDASECCLIHADLQRAGTSYKGDGDVGIFMNPFVRVAYDTKTFDWLWLTRRFERLYTVPHQVVNWLVGLPWFNPRRTEQEGTEVREKVWIPSRESSNGGSFQEISRIGTGDGYCGMRTLQVIKESPRKGEKNWETIAAPPE